MQIKDIQCNLYRIPLPVVLTDATHGEIPDFELITVRIRTASGMEGVWIFPSRIFPTWAA